MAPGHISQRSTGLRIVSLAPSCTSILCALGAKRQLVAVTRWCADVCSVRGLPAIGDCWRNNSMEKIARLRPTLIVGSVPFHAETVARILTIPAQFLALNPRSLADIDSHVRTLFCSPGPPPEVALIRERHFRTLRGKAFLRYITSGSL